MEMGICTISGMMAVVSGVVLARFAIGPSFDKRRPKWVEVELEEGKGYSGSFERVVLEYETKDGWLKRQAKTLAYIQRKGSDKVLAISAGCTHLGCIVTWDEGQQIFKCPCHDGRFDAEGNVLSGPPPAPRTDTVAFGGVTSETA
jgi:Rieske Fe-S protein